MVSKFNIKVLAWNCQGAGSSLTVPSLKEVCNLHSPNLVFLSEMKNQKNIMEKIKKRIKYDNIFVVNPSSKAGGLAIFWNCDLKIDKILFTDFTIEVKVAANLESGSWWCICVYGNSKVAIRQKQWEVLSERRRLWNNKMVFIGDFNDIISNEEKSGGRV